MVDWSDQMSTPSAQIWVQAGKECACIKIQGRANFVSSIDFNAVLTQLRQRGYSHFIIELSECALMDSTFLGVLAGFGLRMTQPNGTQSLHPVELHNANARITELLENLGVLYLFTTSHGAEYTEATDARPHDMSSHTREEVTRTCLEAHKTLMDINPNNVSRFKDVTKFLAEDLARIKRPGI
jgi:anti-sigma B factor antagonist